MKRLPPELRAALTEFARERIKDVSHDAGYVSPQTLAENIVNAQEFAWMAHFTKIEAGMPKEGSTLSAIKEIFDGAYLQATQDGAGDPELSAALSVYHAGWRAAFSARMLTVGPRLPRFDGIVRAAWADLLIAYEARGRDSDEYQSALSRFESVSGFRA